MYELKYALSHLWVNELITCNFRLKRKKKINLQKSAICRRNIQSVIDLGIPTAAQTFWAGAKLRHRKIIKCFCCANYNYNNHQFYTLNITFVQNVQCLRFIWIFFFVVLCHNCYLKKKVDLMLPLLFQFAFILMCIMVENISHAESKQFAAQCEYLKGLMRISYSY